MTVLANDTRIVNFFNSMKTKPKNDKGQFIGRVDNSSGLLYVIGNSHIQVWLPMDLIEYANAAAGSDKGLRPVGIRVSGFKSADEAANELADIFSSPENLAKFINQSEADFHDVYPGVGINIDSRLANDAWSDLYAKYDIKTLASVFGRDTVIEARKLLTVNEFELRFGLTLAA